MSGMMPKFQTSRSSSWTPYPRPLSPCEGKQEVVNSKTWGHMKRILPGLLLAGCLLVSAVPVQAQCEIRKATLAEADQATPEISTEELLEILSTGSAVVLDVRPFQEFATSHIPGAANVSAKPGVEMSLYVSDVKEVGRLVRGKKDAPIVVYCNGPRCGKAKRLGEELAEAGFSNVRRYQLGIPVWRALGGVTQIEAEGVRYVTQNDGSAVLIDVRSAEDFQRGSAPGAKNIPFSRMEPGKNVGVLRDAKNDGRLPMLDHNTRIIVFGASGSDARSVAEEITEEAFHNVAFFDGTAEAFLELLRR